MKLVIAIVQPTKVQAVQEALARVGVERMTVCDAEGYGQQRGQTELYRGVEYQTRLLRKAVLEIAVNDDFLDRTVDTIIDVARSGHEGNIGDGKVFVLPLADVWQIGGTERGPSAI